VALQEDGKRKLVSFCLLLTEICFLAESGKALAEVAKMIFQTRAK
jgi:hypothetical protein